jgi:hypothetical protein
MGRCREERADVGFLRLGEVVDEGGEANGVHGHLQLSGLRVSSSFAFHASKRGDETVTA